MNQYISILYRDREPAERTRTHNQSLLPPISRYPNLSAYTLFSKSLNTFVQDTHFLTTLTQIFSCFRPSSFVCIPWPLLYLSLFSRPVATLSFSSPVSWSIHRYVFLQSHAHFQDIEQSPSGHVGDLYGVSLSIEVVGVLSFNGL